MHRLWLLALTALLGCNTTLQAKDYSQACMIDSDCVAVYVGTVCGPCPGCPNASIRLTEMSKYDDDAKALRSGCISLSAERAQCAACRAPVVACVAGTCTLKGTP